MKAVVFCGGRGASVLIPKLLSQGVETTCVVNAYDDGHSTGHLREALGILGPSDCRKNVEYFLPPNSSTGIQEFLNAREATLISFDQLSTNLETCAKTLKSELDTGMLVKSLFDTAQWLRESSISAQNIENCSYANLLFAFFASQKCSSFQLATDCFASVFNTHPNVLINSEANLSLMAVTKSGHFLQRESDIVTGRTSVEIDSLYLIPWHKREEVIAKVLNSDDFYNRLEILQSFSVLPTVCDRTAASISSADLLIYAPGTFNSSLLPTLMTQGINSAIEKSGAKKIFISNIGADYETRNFKASKFLDQMATVLGLTPPHFVDLFVANKPDKIQDHHIILDYQSNIFDGVSTLFGNFENHYKPGTHSSSVIDSIFAHLKLY